jgi:RNA polymerase sigma factor for flagellar operon FliA
MSHLPKVKYIAERFAAKLPASVAREDIYGAGVLGLIDAVDRYDSSRGVAFTTFAELRVRGAILDNLRSLDWASRGARRRSRELQTAYSQLEQELQRPATEVEVAERMKISVAEVYSTLQEGRGLSITALDEADDATGLSPADTVAASDPSPFDEVLSTEQKHRLSEAISLLPDRERQVIALYYVDELTMKEIGAVLSVTESRVSQLRSQAILRIRGAMSR